MAAASRPKGAASVRTPADLSDLSIDRNCGRSTRKGNFWFSVTAPGAGLLGPARGSAGGPPVERAASAGQVEAGRPAEAPSARERVAGAASLIAAACQME